MAEAVELKQPGVEVLQVFQTENPTVIVPTLMPCIQAVCNQVVQVLVDNGAGGYALNQQAKVLVAAYVLCDDGPYPAANFNSKSVVFSINHGPEFTVTFPGALVWSGNISAKMMADFLNDAFTTANVYQDFYASAVGPAASAALQLQTRGKGDQVLFTIRMLAATDSTILTSLLIPEGHTYRGFSSYTQRNAVIPEWAYPDPRGNLDYLSIDYTSVRGFLYLGSSLNLQEGATRQAFLRWGDRTDVLNACNDIRVMADGSGAPVSSIIAFNTGLLAGEDLTAASAILSVVGTPIVFPTVALTGTTLTLDWGDGPQSMTFLGEVANGAALVAALNLSFNDVILGAGKGLDFSVDLLDQLTIATIKKGADAFLEVIAQTTLPDALTILNVTAGGPYTGDRQMVGPPASQPHPVLPGDLLYVDGVYKGKVLQVSPRGNTAILKGEVRIDKQYAISSAPTDHFGTTFYFVAQNLPGTVGSDRPDVDMVVDQNNGAVWFKSTLVRDTTGAWISPAALQTYLQYTAVRKDVSPLAERPAMLRINTTTELTSLVEPINPSNPFGIGMYLALLNSSGAQISGIGIDEKTSAEPYGTVDAFTRAFEFLESKEVYALAPLTHDKTIAQIANAHAVTMAEPENKGERIIIFSLEKPERAVDLLVASGECNRSAGLATVDTGIANLSSLLLANGVDPTGTILAAEGVFITVENDSAHYSVKSVSGSVVTIRYQNADFVPGENDDAFYYATGALPTTPWISFAFGVNIRGAELLLTDGNPDKEAMADTYQDLGKSFSSRRFWNLVLDKCYATFEGVLQELPGFYVCAAYAGLIGGQPPQQSFTNFPIIGFNRVSGTNGYFSTRQLNRIAAGGNTIIIQEPQDVGAIFPRMALTTDMTSVETRTDSITKVLDFTAKFLRTGLRIFIGRFNINQGYLDTLSHVVQGLLQFLTGTFVLVDAEINNLVQDEDNPDTVLLDITVDPPYPCNYIRIRLIV